MLRRVTVFPNGSKKGGKVLRVEESLEEMLSVIRNNFNSPHYKILYTEKGGELTSVDLIRDDEILYASKGEDFINPNTAGELGNGWVKLNVGGVLFYTTTTVLGREPNSMLAKMFSPDSGLTPSTLDSSGAYLLDRDPRYFSILLNYLRTGTLIIDEGVSAKGVYAEAAFLGLVSVLDELEPLIQDKEKAPLRRRDVMKALISTPFTSQLRFQGVDLTGADLSYMDLRNCNFKYAKLRGANLSHCNLSSCSFERAEMNGVNLNHSILTGVRMNGANMEGSSLRQSNFQDPSGSLNANMEGVNLRDSVLEDSDLSHVNLRVANLKRANLKATILRGAVLAGADLSGSDLHEANLRGANLLNAQLELMINPLHMAQAIR